MRFLMFISADAGRAERWLGLSDEEKEAAEAPLREWFERHGAAGRIESGHETAFPRDVIAITVGEDGPVVSHDPEDGPALATGVLVLETESVEEAVEIASSWPDLVAPADRVTLIPIRGYDP
jgi:hypothetical protein